LGGCLFLTLFLDFPLKEKLAPPAPSKEEIKGGKRKETHKYPREKNRGTPKIPPTPKRFLPKIVVVERVGKSKQMETALRLPPQV